MATITKHVGKIKDAGTRVAIMYRTLPDDKESALVVSTDNLPTIYHDAFIAMIDSPEGQQSNELYEIANRRAFPDGKNMLTALHESGNLVKVPTSNVMVMPNPVWKDECHFGYFSGFKVEKGAEFPVGDARRYF